MRYVDHKEGSHGRTVFILLVPTHPGGFGKAARGIQPPAKELMMAEILTTIGCLIAGATLASIIWSIVRPARRIWPPREYGTLTPLFVWIPTFSLFGIVIVLGIMGWKELNLAQWVRYGIGGALIVLGNLAVWTEVAYFGIQQTGGAQGSLRTNGLYRYSRNPQYVADIAILVGWGLLSASLVALPVIAAGIAVLLAAPFSEEPWLQERYGLAFTAYKSEVRRFL